MEKATFYLASQSARRRRLLTEWGFRYELLSDPRMPEVDETPLPNEPADSYVVRVAREKALNAHRFVRDFDFPLMPVLTADTVVVLNDKILRKPIDENDAVDILSKLSGQTHQVMSAVCLIDGKGSLHEVVSVSDVTFARLSADQIKCYVATGEPMDKAGAYGIQGKAAVFISHINGSYTGIVGLPAYETSLLLANWR